MKKKFILFFLLFGIAAVAQNSVYTPSHVQHLKNCSPYTEEYLTRIPAENGDLNLRSTETIVGWLNSKCVTKSSVYSYELGQEIVSTKCSIPKEKLNSLIEKMTVLNKSNDENVRKSLNNDLSSMIKDPSICKVKNLISQ